MRDPVRARRRALTIELLIATALLAVACGSDRSDDAGADGGAPSTSTSSVAPSSTPSTEPPTTTAPLTEEQLIVQTVRDMWLMFKTVGAKPDPDSPELERYLAGEQLERSRAAMAELKDKGYVVQEPPNSRWEQRPQVVSIDGDSAVVEDCEIDDLWVVQPPRDGVPGALIDGEAVVARWRITLAKIDGSWRVVVNEELEVWYSGDPGCTVDW